MILEKFMKRLFKTKIEKYLNYIENISGYSASTVETYKLNLFESLKYIKIILEDDIYKIDLYPYRKILINKNKKTIYKKISILKSFVHYLKDQGLLVSVIGDDRVRVSQTLPKPIAYKYIKEALSLCSEREKILIYLIYTLGLRVSEVSKLKKEDIKNEWVIVKGKGAKIREIPLLGETQKRLESYLNSSGVNQYVFEKSGRSLSDNQIRYIVSKIFTRVGIKVTPHQIRHSFATDLLNGGARIMDVSEMLGHSSLSTTQIYTKLSSSIKRKNYEKSHPLCGEVDEFI